MSLTSQQELEALLDSYGDVLGEYVLQLVEGAGCVVSFARTPIRAGAGLVIWDLDDTLVGYAKAKERRCDAYEGLLIRFGLAPNKATPRHLMDLTDHYARWTHGKEQLYHLKTHAEVLAWVTSLLDAVPGPVRSAVVKSVEGYLARPGEFTPASISVGSRTIDPKDLDMWRKRVEDLFAKSMFSPPKYDDAVGALVTLGQGARSVNQVVCTHGELDFQLTKLLGLMREQQQMGRPLGISQVWLTDVSKGVLVRKLYRQGSELLRTSGSIVLVDDDVNRIKEIVGLQDEAGEPLVKGYLHLLRAGTSHGRQSPDWWTGRSFDPGATGVDMAGAIRAQLQQ